MRAPPQERLGVSPFPLKRPRSFHLERGMEDFELNTIPKLSYYPLPMQSPEPAGMLTPPLRTAGSVPFLWEEAPGKPRSFHPSLPHDFPARGLDLPPRLLSEMKTSSLTLSSPTTVLDGPDLARTASFSSHRSTRDTSPDTPAKGQLGFVQKKEKEKFVGFWGKRGWRVKGRSMDFDERGDASMMLSSASSFSSIVLGDGDDTKVKITRFKRKGSFINISHATSHFWATIYGSFKQVVPWRGRKLK